MDSAGELALRELIMHEVARRTATSTYLTSKDLAAFPIDGANRRLLDRGAGIWNPSDMSATLAIRSDPSSEYDDEDMGGGRFRYSYQRGGDAGRNTKLRRAMELSLPIIMFRVIGDQMFVPIFPVYVVEDDQENRAFYLALSESLRFLPTPEDQSLDQRRYAEAIVRRRLHQPEFRAKVLLAYGTKCAVCVLKKAPLLDAAHIIGDIDEGGLPVVSNGLTLCKIHHAAYDNNYLGISPDCIVHINDELLRETDGPMLKHGIQEMDGRPLSLPEKANDRPSSDRLATRFEQFRSAS